MTQANSEIIVDIAIVGGGMVGATLARLLSKLPYRIALIDRHEISTPSGNFAMSISEFDPRVSALTQASKSLFEDLGVWQTMKNLRVSPYSAMQVWDADGTGAIDFNAAAMAVDELGHIVENSVILAGLYEEIAQLENVMLLGGIEIAEYSQTAGLATLMAADGSRIKASLLVAADGANSLIRRLANFDTKQWDYEHSAIVTTVETEKPHKHCALQRFMETGPLAFLPLQQGSGLAGENYCSIVWSCVPQLAQSLYTMPEQEFNHKIAQAIEFKLGDIRSSAKRFCVPLKQMHATHYVKGNVVLVGDAAHSIHPLAGQGVNLGFLDVAALADELSQASLSGRLLDDPIVLGRYERKRKAHNLSTMWMMEGFKHLFAEDRLPVRWLRNLGLNTLNDLPLIKNRLAKHAMGLERP